MIDPLSAGNKSPDYIETLQKYKAPSYMAADVRFIKSPILEHDVTVFDLNGAAIALRRLQAIVGARNTVAGWRHDPVTGEPRIRSFGDLCMLIITELGEAYEGYRKGDRMDDHLPKRKMAEVEMADMVYRILDACDELNYDLGGAFAEKMAFNVQRADHSRAERVKDGGKKL